MFEKNPIIPLAFLIHSRRFHEHHVHFLEAIRKAVPLLASKKIVIVTDREFKFSEIFPLGYHVYCWNHLETDLHFFLKNTANCNASEIFYYANTFKELMMIDTEVEFEQAWLTLKSNHFFSEKPKVCNYFNDRLLPAFKAHSAIWVLKSAGVLNPENGLTNNASESMNSVLHNLKQWKQVPLDVICVSLFISAAIIIEKLKGDFISVVQW